MIDHSLSEIRYLFLDTSGTQPAEKRSAWQDQHPGPGLTIGRSRRFHQRGQGERTFRTLVSSDDLPQFLPGHAPNVSSTLEEVPVWLSVPLVVSASWSCSLSSFVLDCFACARKPEDDDEHDRATA